MYNFLRAGRGCPSYYLYPSQKTLTSTLEAYGEVNGPSAMAKTVGVPCGVAVDCILKGKIAKAGVHAPYDEEVRPCSLNGFVR